MQFSSNFIHSLFGARISAVCRRVKIAYPAGQSVLSAVLKGVFMGHSDHHHHEIDEKSTKITVWISLALFFAMTVTGHYVFVASQHHAAPAESHAAPHGNAH